MQLPIDSFEEDTSNEETPSKGSNFLVSAIMILRRQRRELQEELSRLRERVLLLENQNAGLVNVGADRLLGKQG